MKKHQGHQEYVFKVRDDTRRYMDQILQENEKLGNLVNALEDELERQADQMSEARHELDRERAERERLRAQVSDMGRENRRMSEEDQEIVANLIGSEEIAIFEMHEGQLEFLASRGVDPASLQPTTLDDAGEGRVRELIEEIARSGERYVATEPREAGSAVSDSGLTACVPLKLDGEVTGAIAVFRLLSQKTGFAPLDFELFDLLATHAAVALYCSRRDHPLALASAPTG